MLLHSRWKWQNNFLDLTQVIMDTEHVQGESTCHANEYILRKIFFHHLAYLAQIWRRF